jgi:hypothetical protein
MRGSRVASALPTATASLPPVSRARGPSGGGASPAAPTSTSLRRSTQGADPPSNTASGRNSPALGSPALGSGLRSSAGGTRSSGAGAAAAAAPPSRAGGGRGGGGPADSGRYPARVPLGWHSGPVDAAGVLCDLSERRAGARSRTQARDTRRVHSWAMRPDAPRSCARFPRSHGCPAETRSPSSPSALRSRGAWLVSSRAAPGRPNTCSAADWSRGEVVIGSTDHALYVLDAVRGVRKRTLYSKAAGHSE